MVLLFDESLSLRTSDPDAGRVVAAGYLLDRLAGLGERTGAEINVLISGFGTSFRDYGGTWHHLDRTDKNTTELVDDFASRNIDTGTDYWLGLDGARKALVDRGEEGLDACRAIVFFSDGELDVSLSPEEIAGGVGANPRRPFAPDNGMRTRADERRASEAAASSLCRPGGLADQIRTEEIVVFGVGLSPDGAPGDFELMRNVVTGGEPDGTCGEVTVPVPGSFALASGVDDLVFAFDAVDSGSSTTETPICQGVACEAGRHPFVLDRTVSTVEILGSADADGLEVELILPSGESVVLPSQGSTASLAIPGVVSELEWLSPRTFTLTLDSTTDDGWIGVWALTFTDKNATSDGKKARTSIQVSGDVRPVLNTGDAPPRVGEEYPAYVEFVATDGSIVDPSKIIADGSVAVMLLGPEGTQRALGEREIQRLSEPFVAEFESNGRHVVRIAVDIELRAVSSSGGDEVTTQLAQQVVDAPLNVLPPHGYPSLAGTVDFGREEGRLDATASLAVEGPGCVWLAEGAYEVATTPEGVSDVVLHSDHATRDTCLAVPEGTEGGLPLQLTSDSAGNGAILGEMLVEMAPLTGGDPKQVTVSFRAELEKPLNLVNFAVMLVVAIVFGGGLPLVIAYLMKFVGASKIPPTPLIANVMDISLVHGAVRRDQGPLVFHEDEMRNLYTPHGSARRRLEIGEATLRSVLGWSPFGAGQVKVWMDGHQAVADTGSGPSGRDGHARIPLAVHDHWVVFVSPEGRMKLLTLVAGTAMRDERDDLLRDAASKIPLIVEGLGIATAEESPQGFAQESSDASPASDWDPFA